MKNKNQILKSRVLVFGLASASLLLILTLTSCNNTKNPKHEDTKDVAEEQ